MPSEPHAAPPRNRFRRIAFALLTATGAAALAASPARAQQAEDVPVVTLKGRVIDISTGQPLPEAAIEVRNLRQRVHADQHGEFAISVPRGAHLVRFMGMGYDTINEVWTAAQDDAGLVVELTPKPLLLEAISVQSRILERRLERLPIQTRAFSKAEIRNFGHSGTIDFLDLYAGLRPIVCDGGGVGCAGVRGRVQNVTVVIDELPSISGLDELRGIPLQEIHRMEVLEGGSHVRVYTKHFVLRMAQRGGRALRPILHNSGGFRRAAARP